MAIETASKFSLLKLVVVNIPILLLSASCATDDVVHRRLPEEIMDASSEFRENQSHDSLATIYEFLEVGMSRKYVERILGEPHYCPDTGVCYYYSDKLVPSPTPGLDIPIILGVDYMRRENPGDVGRVITSTLQETYFGPVGE